jgi:TonB family protein
VISIVVKSSLIVVVTFLAVLLLRRQSAATRHMVLTAGLICALTFPLFAAVLPEWHPVAISDYSYGINSLQIVPESSVKSSARSIVAPEAHVLPSLDTTAFWVWLTGSVIAVLVHLIRVASVEWMVRGSQPLTSGRLIAAAATSASALNLRRPVRLLQNQRAVLGTWGVVRPQLLLPHNIHQCSDERLSIVLIHELAHVKRLDWLVQMLAESARVIYWFNPLFWLLCRRLRGESEQACDDVVLDLGTDGKTYAAHLLDIARARKNSERAWTPILAMAQSPNLERRFLAMLNPSLNHSRTTRTSVLIAFAMAICVTLPVAAMHGRAQAPVRVSSSPVAASATVEAPKSSVPIARGVQPKKSPAARPAPVQGEFGSLSGTVYDPTGAVVSGARVKVTNDQTKEIQETETGPVGAFDFPHLQAGEYNFEALLPGFIAFRNRIVIRPDQTLRQNVNLLLGNIIQRITVTASGQPNTATLLPAGTPRRIRVGGNVQAAKLITQVRPVYPPSAQNTGVEGTVVLEGIISTDGTFQSLRVLSSIDRDLTAAALDAVRQWRYGPTLLNGEAVEVLTTINVDFKLTQ